MSGRAFSTLHLALGASAVAHGVLLALLGWRMVDPGTFNRVLRETPLEVILVNARTAGQTPEKPAALAQASLAGGGDLDKGRATSPLPPSAFTAVGDSAEEAQRQIEAMQAQQMTLLSQVRQQLAALPLADPQQAGQPSQNQEQEERRRQLLEQLAEIERRVDQENARPKRRYVSPATKEATYAVYVDALRRSIEMRGTEHFPEAGGKKLYGELVMIVGVNFDGSLVSADIIESSGDKELDRRARAIVASIGSFGPFTEAMRQQTDQLLMPSRFKFTRDATLETQVSTQPVN